MKKTKTEERFNKFIEKVKTAKNDYEIATAGFDLLESYRAFRTYQLARQSLTIIDHIFKKGV